MNPENHCILGNMSKVQRAKYIEQIKADIPETPDEVINIWLSDCINRFGWPPENENDWRYVLRGSKDLAYLQSLRWQLQKVKFKPAIFTPLDKGLLINLFKQNFLSQKDIHSEYAIDSLRRFESVKRYIKEKYVFPKPVVLGLSSDGYEIHDGNHRITALFYLLGYYNVQNDEIPCVNINDEQIAWVSTSI